MKNLVEQLNAKLGRKHIFKPTIGSESLHQDSNDNNVIIVKFAMSKNIVLWSTVFPHTNIRK
jgi:hypothetical protein